MAAILANLRRVRAAAEALASAKDVFNWKLLGPRYSAHSGRLLDPSSWFEEMNLARLNGLVAELAAPAPNESLNDIFLSIAEYPPATAFRWFEGDSGSCLKAVTWTEFSMETSVVARALLARGLSPCAKVAIVAPTCYRWVVIDAAVLRAGGCTVGIYPSQIADECADLIDQAGVVVLFLADRAAWNGLRGKLGVRVDRMTIVLMSGESDLGIYSWNEFVSGANAVTEAELRSRALGVGAASAASIVYTSGTNGYPRGVVLTHGNLLFAVRSACLSSDIRWADHTFLFLPLAHAFARLCVYVAILSGNCTTFGRGTEQLAQDLRWARPHWFAAVPKVFERAKARAMEAVERSNPFRLRVARWALSIGDERAGYLLAGVPVPNQLRIRHRLAWLLGLRKLKQAFGGRIRFVFSGSAPLDIETARFFLSASVLVLEGIGMTENAAFSHVNRVNRFQIGSVGLPGSGIEARIADDGELLIRGPNVMSGYWRAEEETKAAIDDAGWLRTGDLGEIDAAGFLRIIGRKKDLLITSGGRNVAPTAIEAQLCRSRLIHQAVVLGDRRPFLTALVTVGADASARWFADQGLSTPACVHPSPEIERALALEIERINQGLVEHQRIRRFRVVPEFTLEDGLMTATAKQRRRLIEARYREEIEQMYAR